MTAKYGTPYFSNYINSDMQPSDVRSMCCRLRLDLRELRKKTGGFFGSGESTGSVGVVTINMPRIAYLATDEADFFKRLDHMMDISARSLKIKRGVISRLLEGAFHNYKLSIPSGFKTEVIITKKDFINSLERCSLIIDDKNKSPIRCEVGNGVIKISCKTGIGRVNDAISADISGETVTIGFNNKLVLEALRAAEGDKVRVRFNGAMKVIEILPLEGESYIYLIMPIQLKN
jgi:hypothetical protein